MSARIDTQLIAVTDHAVLRYLERLCGIDVDAVRATLLADGRGALVARIAKGKIVAHELGARLVVNNGRVVSVTEIEPIAPYRRTRR